MKTNEFFLQGEKKIQILTLFQTTAVGFQTL